MCQPEQVEELGIQQPRARPKEVTNAVAAVVVAAVEKPPVKVRVDVATAEVTAVLSMVGM